MLKLKHLDRALQHQAWMDGAAERPLAAPAATRRPAGAGSVTPQHLHCSGDGKVHYEGSALCTLETACGYVDTTNTYTPTNEPVDCQGCRDVARMFGAAGNELKAARSKKSTQR